MNNLLLSRITKDFLNLDPEFIPDSKRYRMGWSGSCLAPHEQTVAKKRKKSSLLRLKKRFESKWPHDTGTSPKLQLPLSREGNGSFLPPRYFSRGVMDTHPGKNPEPISYLLTQKFEDTNIKGVQAPIQFFKSLLKGKGILRKSDAGFIYLDIDNRFINMLIPFLKRYGLSRPPYFNLFENSLGAHIPVITQREIHFHYLQEFEKIGKEFSFEIEGLYSTEPTNWPEVEEVWFFKVKSENLEDLRRRHFLAPLPQGHSFHIAIAVKSRLGITDLPMQAPFMQINPTLASVC